eukprot:COSAG02_NODE_1272_length_13523_cov_3.824866_15_plen_256_part_00
MGETERQRGSQSPADSERNAENISHRRLDQNRLVLRLHSSRRRHGSGGGSGSSSSSRGGSEVRSVLYPVPSARSGTAFCLCIDGLSSTSGRTAVGVTHVPRDCDTGPPCPALLCSHTLLRGQVAGRRKLSSRWHGLVRLRRRHPGDAAAAQAHRRRRTGWGVLLRESVRDAQHVSRRVRSALARSAGHRQRGDTPKRELRACAILLRRLVCSVSDISLPVSSMRRQNSAHSGKLSHAKSPVSAGLRFGRCTSTAA